jgi:hypothetical protein
VGCRVGAGTGDAVTAGKEVTGIVPSDPPGVMVQPKVTMHETSTSETQTVLMDTIDPDTFLHPNKLFSIFSNLRKNQNELMLMTVYLLPYCS